MCLIVFIISRMLIFTESFQVLLSLSLLLVVCYVVSTQQIPSATCVVSSLQKKEKSTAWRVVFVQKKPIIHTLACLSVTRINVGHHTLCVNTVVVLQKVGLEGRKGRCVLLSQIISQTVTSVWWIQVNEKRERTHLPSSTLTFRHLLHLYPTQKTCLCHNHPKKMNLS